MKKDGEYLLECFYNCPRYLDQGDTLQAIALSRNSDPMTLHLTPWALDFSPWGEDYPKPILHRFTKYIVGPVAIEGLTAKVEIFTIHNICTFPRTKKLAQIYQHDCS